MRPGSRDSSPGSASGAGAGGARRSRLAPQPRKRRARISVEQLEPRFLLAGSNDLPWLVTQPVQIELGSTPDSTTDPDGAGCSVPAAPDTPQTVTAPDTPQTVTAPDTPQTVAAPDTPQTVVAPTPAQTPLLLIPASSFSSAVFGDSSFGASWRSPQSAAESRGPWFLAQPFTDSWDPSGWSDAGTVGAVFETTTNGSSGSSTANQPPSSGSQTGALVGEYEPIPLAAVLASGSVGSVTSSPGSSSPGIPTPPLFPTIPVDFPAGRDLAEVTDSLSSQQPAKAYRVFIESGTLVLEIDLRSDAEVSAPPPPRPAVAPALSGIGSGLVATLGASGAPGSASVMGPPPTSSSPNMEITVLDPNGRELAQAVKGPGDLRMVLSLDKLGAMGDSSLLVEVSVQSSSSSSLGSTPVTFPTPINFALAMTRYSFVGVESTVASGTGLLPSAVPTMALADRGPAVAFSSTGGLTGRLPAGPLWQPPGESTFSPLPVAAGPLPMRAVAALGGLLADGDPIPIVDGRGEVVVDLDLLGLPLSNPAVPAVSNGVDSSGTLVAIRGPGGFPLLASGVRTDLQAVRNSLATLPWVRAAASHPVAAQETGANENTAVASKGHAVSKIAGTGLAVILMLGLTFPQLIDSLAISPLPRFVECLRRLRRACSRHRRRQ